MTFLDIPRLVFLGSPSIDRIVEHAHAREPTDNKNETAGVHLTRINSGERDGSTVRLNVGFIERAVNTFLIVVLTAVQGGQGVCFVGSAA